MFLTKGFISLLKKSHARLPFINILSVLNYELSAFQFLTTTAALFIWDLPNAPSVCSPGVPWDSSCPSVASSSKRLRWIKLILLLQARTATYHLKHALNAGLLPRKLLRTQVCQDSGWGCTNRQLLQQLRAPRAAPAPLCRSLPAPHSPGKLHQAGLYPRGHLGQNQLRLPAQHRASTGEPVPVAPHLQNKSYFRAF